MLGYGLEWEAELRLLKVLHQASHCQEAVELEATYLGAHSVPPGMTSDEQTRHIVDSHLPALAQEIQHQTISPRFIDVFLEKGVFSFENTREILEVRTSSLLFVLIDWFLFIVIDFCTGW